MQSLHPRRGWECTTAQEAGLGLAFLFPRYADRPTSKAGPMVIGSRRESVMAVGPIW